MNIKGILCSTILAVSIGSGLPLVSMAAPRAKATEQHFVCNTGYTLEDCHVQMIVLRRTLAKYPTDRLGDWTWVLVRSRDWKRILGDRGLVQTVLHSVILPNERPSSKKLWWRMSQNRGVELSGLWHMTVDELLDLAVRHELGHAVCNERDEVEANRAAESLLRRKPISCDRTF